MLKYQEYIDEINRMNESQSKLESELKELRTKKEDELKEVVEAIEKKYGDSIIGINNELSELRSKKSDTAFLLNSYSSFYSPDICDLFAACVMFVEGERFLPLYYQNSKLNKKIPWCMHWSVLVRESALKEINQLDTFILKDLIEKGDAFQLTDSFTSSTEFYSLSGEKNYNLGKFEYLEDLIKCLIQFRIDNDKTALEDVSKEEMDQVLLCFLTSHPELCSKNKDKRKALLYESKFDKPYKTVVPLCRKLNNEIK